MPYILKSTVDVVYIEVEDGSRDELLIDKVDDGFGGRDIDTV